LSNVKVALNDWSFRCAHWHQKSSA